MPSHSLLLKKYGIEIKIKAIELYKKGKSCKEIGEELNVNYITVWRWVERYKKYGLEGVERKDKGV